MEFGLVLTQFSDRWQHVTGDAELAEDVGLDSVWLVDHLLGTAGAEMPVFEAWTGLAYVAGITERVRLGHLVNCVSFRNPGLLAKMATTLDHASGGRLDLGLGAGWYEAEYTSFGYEFPSAGDRRRYFEAYVEALIALFAGGAVSMDKDGVVLDDAQVVPGPVQQPHPPIVIGAGRPHMLAATGRLGDVWNCPAGLIDGMEDARRAVDEAADGRTVRTTIQVPVAVGRTDEELAAAAAAGEASLGWMGDWKRIGITGTVDEAAAKVEAYRNRGVDGFIGVVPGTRQRADFVRAYGEVAARF